MNDIPVGCYLDRMCRYRCGLCFWFKSDELEDIQSHMPRDSDGYCKNGMRSIGINIFQCICGETFKKGEYQDYSPLAAAHVDEAKCTNKRKTFCDKCQIQLDCQAALERHYASKRHKELEGPVLKDIYCKTCEIQCHTQKQFKTHINTAKHKQRLENGTLSLTCDICQITCKGQKQMIAHLATNKHKKHILV